MSIDTSKVADSNTSAATASKPNRAGAVATWADDVTVYPVAREIRYKNEDGTGEITTSFAYTWHADSLVMEQRMTTLPVVPAEQHGPGTALGLGG